jgi:hypothetical protein
MGDKEGLMGVALTARRNVMKRIMAKASQMVLEVKEKAVEKG